MPAKYMCFVCCTLTVDCAIVSSHQHMYYRLQCHVCFTAVYTLAVDMPRMMHSGAAWVRGCCAHTPLLTMTAAGRDGATYMAKLNVHFQVIYILHVQEDGEPYPHVILQNLHGPGMPPGHHGQGLDEELKQVCIRSEPLLQAPQYGSPGGRMCPASTLH